MLKCANFEGARLNFTSYQTSFSNAIYHPETTTKLVFLTTTSVTISYRATVYFCACVFDSKCQPHSYVSGM